MEGTDRAREEAIPEPVVVVIHGKDGTIHDRDTYGNDPHPPKSRNHWAGLILQGIRRGVLYGFDSPNNPPTADRNRRRRKEYPHRPIR